jgi:SAM-dependent methyltransferase
MPKQFDPDLHTFVQWDVRNWSRALRFWLEVIGPKGLEGAEALELGSRDGGLSLWLARQGAARVVCSDLEGPADTAHDLHREAGVSKRIEYAPIDARQIGRAEAFDIVVFKSVLGGIGGVGGLEAQAQAIRSIHESLRPGGQLLFAENLTASPLHVGLRRRFVRWSEHWRYLDAAEVDPLLDPFYSVRSTTFGFVAAFGRNERQRSALARLDVAGLDRAVPRSWRYIVAGVATK